MSPEQETIMRAFFERTRTISNRSLALTAALGRLNTQSIMLLGNAQVHPALKLPEKEINDIKELLNESERIIEGN